MKKSKRVKLAIRKSIQGLYEIAEVSKGKKKKAEIYYSIGHLNNVLKNTKGKL